MLLIHRWTAHFCPEAETISIDEVADQHDERDFASFSSDRGATEVQRI